MTLTPQLSSLLDIIADPGSEPDAALVARLADDAPWFPLPAALRLQRCGPALGEAERLELKRRVALTSIADPSMLAALADDRDGAMWASFYPPDDTPSRPDTGDAITTFLETYGHGADEAEDSLLERLILNPQPDYASVLEEQYGSEPPAAPSTGRDALIDAFLANPHRLETPPEAAPAPAPAPEGARRAPAAPAPADAPLSESLAKIYIRRGRYDKAFEIISNLNLNFPEKSAYFADQLRFLQKLMLIRRPAGEENETK